MRKVYVLGFFGFADILSEIVFSILTVFILNISRSNPAYLGLIEVIARSTQLRAARRLRLLERQILKKEAHGAHRLCARRVGKGVRMASLDALISVSVSGVKSGAAFRLHGTLDQLGAVVSWF